MQTMLSVNLLLHSSVRKFSAKPRRLDCARALRYVCCRISQAWMARHAMPCRVLKLATEIDCSQQHVSARQTAIFAQLTAKTEDAARCGGSLSRSTMPTYYVYCTTLYSILILSDAICIPGKMLSTPKVPQVKEHYKNRDTLTE